MATTESFGARVVSRLPRVLVPYIAGAWGVVQCLDWASTRYLWSPHLVELALAAAALFLPTVVLLAWYRGGGHHPWTRAEKLGIPLNLSVAASLLLVSFHGKELGAVTRRVAVTAADGTTIERVVPKSAFRKHAGLFFFANDSGDKQLDWIGQAIPELAMLDLSQDLFVDAKTQYDFVDAIKRAGPNPGDALPLALDQQLARQSHLDFIVYGRFDKRDSDFVVNVALAPTERGKPIAERTQRGPDLFKLVDVLTTQLRKDLGIPESHVDSAPDLPVAEISTHSLPALRAYVAGKNAWRLEHNARAAEASLDQAQATDSGFAMAGVEEMGVLFADNQQHRMDATRAQVKRNEYRLPERMRFAFDAESALLEQQPDRELQILRQWQSLYPDDTSAHEQMAEAMWRRGRFTDSAAEIERMLELDPGNVAYLLQLGDTMWRQGDSQAALQQYLAYEKRAPNDAQGYLSAARIYQVTSRFDEAKASFQRAAELDPARTEALLGIEGVEMRAGHLAEAQAAIERALAQAHGKDAAAAMQSQIDLYELQGRQRDALGWIHKQWALWSATETLAEGLVKQLMAVDDAIEVGHTDEALQLIARARKVSDNVNINIFAAMASAKVYVELKDTAKVTAALDELEKAIHAYDITQMTPFLSYVRGRVEEQNGAWARAADQYREELKSGPSTEVLVRLAGCQRRLKQLKEAHASLAQALRLYPAYPQLHVELARLYADEGERAKATAELQAALAVWAHADDGYAPAAEARALVASLRGGG